ncbi:solute carrier family 35 member F3-like [Carpediemonas membranifera]|uniref:Solute carrier family 35 member F3-like n=1 Tax=Carpediemonas membranifera TaxID=201153 RepID=A0A8J6B2Q3_9EUKA|nr:solute carrier family 35 member F3-like [Carpediemonas membranifera]|eukprot:KAG9391712.1 solute carrier family 35 member F3-like [Carpediemonas membranifera]
MKASFCERGGADSSVVSMRRSDSSQELLLLQTDEESVISEQPEEEHHKLFHRLRRALGAIVLSIVVSVLYSINTELLQTLDDYFSPLLITWTMHSSMIILVPVPVMGFIIFRPKLGLRDFLVLVYRLVMCASLYFLTNGLFIMSLKFIPPSVATSVFQLTPIVVLAATTLLDLRFPAILSVIGSIVVVLASILFTVVVSNPVHANIRRILVGLAISLMSLLMNSSYQLWVKRYLQDTPTATILSAIALFHVAVLWPIAAVSVPKPMPDTVQWGKLALSSGISLVVTFLSFFAISLFNPVVFSSGQGLNGPITFIFDLILHRAGSFSALRMAIAAVSGVLVTVGFMAVVA